MFYDLDSLEEFCRELGFASCRASPDALEVTLLEGVVLDFVNYRNGEDVQDSLCGFNDAPWHFHGKLELETGDRTSVELDELDVLQGLRSGTILFAEQYLNGVLKDRWLVHKDAPADKVDFEYIEPGEELRFRRLA